MFSSMSLPIILNKSQAWDIDDYEDWKIAKCLFTSKKIKIDYFI